MAYDDRYGDRGDWRGQDRGRGGARGGDRGDGRDPQDRDPGAHVNYYQGGDRGQRRYGPEGGFEMREDYRRTDRHADQGRAQARRNDDDDRWSEHGPGGSQTGSGSGGVDGYQGAYGEERDSGDGSAGPGFDPEFGGPRFDRQDIGSTGTHGAHAVSSAYGTAQTSQGEPSGIGGGSARNRAILEQYERQQRSGRTQPRDLMPEQMGRNQDQAGQRGYAHDPHYAEWRRRHMESLDRDYHEYSTENASRFESEFGSWRETRGQQRQAVGRAAEHMEVVGSDGAHVGTVDKVKGDRIVLTKRDEAAGGHHHSIPCAWIDRVEDKVVLNRTAEQAQQAWRDEETNRALFDQQGRGDDNPRNLDRNFSGTYRDE